MNTLKSNLKVAYLDYVNNYTSTAGFAAAYGLTPRQAGLVIEIGREIHEAAVDQLDASPLARLRHHVTGAIERGEKSAVVEKPAAKNFTVVAVSTNTNSFGYRCVLCLAEDGEGFQFLVQAYGTDKVPAQGDVVTKADSRWYGAPHPLKKIAAEQAKKILASLK